MSANIDPEDLWIGRNGATVAMASMTTAHLLNALPFAAQRFDEAEEGQASAYAVAATTVGDAASYYMGHATDEADANVRLEAMRIANMVHELAKRGVPVPGLPAREDAR